MQPISFRCGDHTCWTPLQRSSRMAARPWLLTASQLLPASSPAAPSSRAASALLLLGHTSQRTRRTQHTVAAAATCINHRQGHPAWVPCPFTRPRPSSTATVAAAAAAAHSTAFGRGSSSRGAFSCGTRWHPSGAGWPSSPPSPPPHAASPAAPAAAAAAAQDDFFAGESTTTPAFPAAAHPGTPSSPSPAAAGAAGAAAATAAAGAGLLGPTTDAAYDDGLFNEREDDLVGDIPDAFGTASAGQRGRLSDDALAAGLDGLDGLDGLGGDAAAALLEAEDLVLADDDDGDGQVFEGEVGRLADAAVDELGGVGAHGALPGRQGAGGGAPAAADAGAWAARSRAGAADWAGVAASSAGSSGVEWDPALRGTAQAAQSTGWQDYQPPRGDSQGRPGRGGQQQWQEPLYSGGPRRSQAGARDTFQARAPQVPADPFEDAATSLYGTTGGSSIFASCNTIEELQTLVASSQAQMSGQDVVDVLLRSIIIESRGPTTRERKQVFGSAQLLAQELGPLLATHMQTLDGEQLLKVLQALTYLQSRDLHLQQALIDAASQLAGGFTPAQLHALVWVACSSDVVQPSLPWLQWAALLCQPVLGALSSDQAASLLHFFVSAGCNPGEQWLEGYLGVVQPQLRAIHPLQCLHMLSALALTGHQPSPAWLSSLDVAIAGWDMGALGHAGQGRLLRCLLQWRHTPAGVAMTGIVSGVLAGPVPPRAADAMELTSLQLQLGAEPSARHMSDVTTVLVSEAQMGVAPGQLAQMLLVLASWTQSVPAARLSISRTCQLLLPTLSITDAAAMAAECSAAGDPPAATTNPPNRVLLQLLGAVSVLGLAPPASWVQAAARALAATNFEGLGVSDLLSLLPVLSCTSSSDATSQAQTHASWIPAYMLRVAQLLSSPPPTDESTSATAGGGDPADSNPNPYSADGQAATLTPQQLAEHLEQVVKVPGSYTSVQYWQALAQGLGGMADQLAREQPGTVSRVVWAVGMLWDRFMSAAGGAGSGGAGGGADGVAVREVNDRLGEAVVAAVLQHAEWVDGELGEWEMARVTVGLQLLGGRHAGAWLQRLDVLVTNHRNELDVRVLV